MAAAGFCVLPYFVVGEVNRPPMLLLEAMQLFAIHSGRLIILENCKWKQKLYMLAKIGHIFLSFNYLDNCRERGKIIFEQGLFSKWKSGQVVGKPLQTNFLRQLLQSSHQAAIMLIGLELQKMPSKWANHMVELVFRRRRSKHPKRCSSCLWEKRCCLPNCWEVSCLVSSKLK